MRSDAVFNGPAVAIENVTLSFGRFKVLDALSLDVPRGLSFGLLGPNGAGKTTAIRMLVGLLRPDSGKVLVFGRRPSAGTAVHVGYMPQLQSLYLELSIKQNVDFFARIYRMNREKRIQRVEEALRLVGMWDRRNDSVHKLSGGMKQRVSLACAIVHEPELLLLDEPTVGLDPELRVVFWQHFRTLTQKGTSIIITSHSMDDAAHCDELAFLREGKVIARGTPENLRRATGKADASLEDAFLFFIHHDGKKDA